jgi:formyl-CoA transferase
MHGHRYLTAIIGRQQTSKGQKVAVAMQDAVLNLCRAKMHDQQRLEKVGYTEEYPQYPHEMDAFETRSRRAAQRRGGGQPGWILKCKGWETDPNAYIYFTVQGHAWEPICDALGKPEWKTDPAYNTPKGRQPHIMDIFATIEDFIKDKTKFEAVDIFRKFDIPCAPVLSMKELLRDESLRKSGSIVEVPHKVRGSYYTIGSPIKFSDLKPEIKASPLLGEHTEVLAELGYSKDQIAAMHAKKAV